MKLIHLTDTHLIESGGVLHDLDPEARFKSCIDDIKLHHSDAECCVITGDLAHNGDLSAYQLLFNELQSCPMKFHLVIGNHDHRREFLHLFQNTKIDECGFIQYDLKTSAGVFLFLDTVQPGTDSGIYCKLRKTWLNKKLKEQNGNPVYLFMHHPPFDIHLPCIDQIGLSDKEYFTEIISEYKSSIRHIFFGHAHRPINGNWMGISFSSLRGTNHQVQLDFKSQLITVLDEPPEYSVVFISENQIVVHTHQYPIKTI